MTQTSQAPHEAPFGASAPASPLRLIGAVCAAHFVSHYYIIILAPLMPFVREAYGISYTEIGLAIAAFNGVTAALQTPAGFLIDKMSARMALGAGLALGGIAFMLVGLVDSYWFLVAMFALAGVANTVFHPADYALLSQHVPEKRIGQAFSIHTFCGMMGSALAPPTLLLMQSIWGWRGAFIGAGILGLVASAVVMVVREGSSRAMAPRAAKNDDKLAGWDLLLSPPILLNMLFFVLLALTSTGITNYSVAAFGILYGTPVTVANTALTCLLLLSALGVLAGGLVVTRTAMHSLLAAFGLAVMGVGAALLAFDLGSFGIIVVMSLHGFFSGAIAPSRDMIVREATPPGSFGKVFGFVTTGFSLGGIVGPMLFGAMMDHGSPRLVFIGAAIAALLAILTVTTLPKRPAGA